MQITDQYRYNRCISIAARLDQIVDMDGIDEEFLSNDECENYIVGASATIYELSDILRSKSKLYVHEDDPNILDR